LISLCSTGCCGCGSLQFNSEYPQELNGIITPEEFYQSMANINKAHRQTFWEVFFAWFGGLCAVAGFVLLVCLSIKTIQDHAVAPVIIGGLCLLVLGGVISVSTGIMLKYSRPIRVRNALADESSKYSTRFMLPFTWREEKRCIPSDDPEDGDYYVDEVSNII
jgi:hypothetical protein